jgi:hypothetical protein
VILCPKIGILSENGKYGIIIYRAATAQGSPLKVHLTRILLKWSSYSRVRTTHHAEGRFDPKVLAVTDFGYPRSSM